MARILIADLRLPDFRDTKGFPTTGSVRAEARARGEGLELRQAQATRHVTPGTLPAVMPALHLVLQSGALT